MLGCPGGCSREGPQPPTRHIQPEHSGRGRTWRPASTSPGQHAVPRVSELPGKESTVWGFVEEVARRKGGGLRGEGSGFWPVPLVSVTREAKWHLDAQIGDNFLLPFSTHENLTVRVSPCVARSRGAGQPPRHAAAPCRPRVVPFSSIKPRKVGLWESEGPPQSALDTHWQKRTENADLAPAGAHLAPPGLAPASL